MQLCLFILSLLLVIASIAPIFNYRVWVLYGLRAQRFQFAVLLVVLLIAFPWFKTGNLWLDLLIFVLMAGAAGYNFYVVYPFTFFAKPEVPTATTQEPQIRLLAANVRMCNEKYQLLLDQIKLREPDVICLSEVNERWIQNLSSLEASYPFTCLKPQDNTYGIALYSKFEMEDCSVKFLVEEEIPSIHTTVCLKNQRKVRFIGLHPRPPAPWTKEENKDFEIITAASCVMEAKLPTIVTGDLNDVAWSPVTKDFKKLSGMLDPRVGRGFFSTYNVYAPFFRMPIDHCFVSSEFSLVALERLPKIGSDHFPILIAFRLKE